MGPKFSSAPIENQPSSSINRRAIDTSGCLGSFYDIYRDQVLGKLTLTIKTKQSWQHNNPECKIVKGKTNDHQNLLKMIDVQDELRLNILLKLAPRTEFTSIIDHPYPIDEYTRILYYTYLSRKEELSKIAEKQIKLSMPQTDATHIITGVNWGIYFVAILQLPPDTTMVEKIDATLENIEISLLDDDNFEELTLNEPGEPQEFINMKVYSNIPTLARTTSLTDAYQKIRHFKVNDTEHHPMNYDLLSIQKIYSQQTDPTNTVGIRCNDQFEQRFLELSTTIKYLDSSINGNMSNILREYFKVQLYDINIRLSAVKKKYEDECKRFATLLLNWRHAYSGISEIEKALNDEQQNILRKNIDDLKQDQQDLKAKEQLINNLQKQEIQYWNAAERDLNQFDYEQRVEQMLIRDDGLDRVLCSNDILNKTKSPIFNKLRDELLEKRKSNPNLRLSYADFSYCSFPISNIIILPRNQMKNKEDTRKQSTSTLAIHPQICNTPASSSQDDIVNILLLGESGVGKSTFINAFVNYLTYNTLNQAELNKPVVLIPVSFMITIGDNFEEHIIQFGDADSTKNEDFDHPGQSVTQRCKSYIFHLKHHNGKKLRIIDTPGFGDTRGLDRDDFNMQHILEYVNNLTHLNAVCLLLKPNVTRLNSYFRTCVTQLLALLGTHVDKNIIFCFTNGRSTFYTPGNTGPLLRAMLDSLSMNHVILKKHNTFCFDSESFRYLVSRQQSIVFNDLDKQEYEMSWSNSATESTRLINYIINSLPVYHRHNQLKSIKHAQFEIIHMIRPILEAMKNILRNIILFDNEPSKISIKLCPKVIYHPTTICLSCERHATQVAKFWILCDYHNEVKNKTPTCLCAPDRHQSIDYALEYETINSPANHDKNRLMDRLILLLHTCIELAHFLMNTAHSSRDDPFLVALTRMIDEEKKICSENKPQQLNSYLVQELENLKKKYESRIHEMKPNQNIIELPVIYERIKTASNYPEVDEQMAAVKKGQENLMALNEYEVPNNPINVPAICPNINEHNSPNGEYF